jgi:dihydroorotate dehydrogenase electron transfer subunit
MPTTFVTAITRNLDLGHGAFLLEFEAPEAARAAQPGQFVMLRIPGAEVLLRRPFSICGLPGTFADGGATAMQLLYKVVGCGTTLLAQLRPGAPLDLIAPLGHGFSIDLPEGAEPLLVAGGIGAGPFPALVAALASRGRRARMIYGARTAADLSLLDWFRAHCDEVVVTTDDGSLGVKGLVTGPLEELLCGPGGGNLSLFACGPEPMLKAVARLAQERNTPCELSLEAHMACGFGACLGCVVPVRRGAGEEPGYDRVCREGPVMPAGKLAW